MKDKRIVFVDVDQVCALLHTVWLERYNKDYNDNLMDENITDWDIDKFVKPECGKKIYDYLRDPSLYDTVVPVEGALEGVNALRELDYRVLFATSCAVEVAGRKFHWLRKHGFVKKERDYIEIRDKSLLRGHYMIDDCYDYIHGFVGYGFLLTKPWNKKYSWYYRVDSWEDFINKMTDFYRKGL